MKSIHGHEIPTSGGTTEGAVLYFDNTKQLEAAREDVAEANRLVAATEYGRGPDAEYPESMTVSVPLATLNNLISAGDQLNDLIRVSSCEETIAEANWLGCVQSIKEVISGQS